MAPPRALAPALLSAFALSFSSSSVARARPLYALTPVQLNSSNPTDYFFGFDSTTPLAADADIAAIHDDFYGVPWAWALGLEPQPPSSWLARLRATQAAVRAWGLPVFLSLQMLNAPLRTCPAQNATDGANGFPSVTNFAGCTGCYDFNTTTNPFAADLIAAYVKYARYYVAAMQDKEKASPAGLYAVDFAAEINLGQRACPDSWWPAVVNMSNAVYAALKEETAGTGVFVFPSIQLDVVMGLQTGPDQPCVGQQSEPTPPPSIFQCIIDGLGLLNFLERDLFAVSTYPHNQMAGFPTQKGGPQPWYLPTVLNLMNEKDRATFAIAETGFVTDTIVVNFANGSVGGAVGIGGGGSRSGGNDPPPLCYPILNTSLQMGADWLSYVTAQATSNAFTFVTWWSDKDLLYSSTMTSCPCQAPPQFQPSCTFISAYRDIYAAISPNEAVYGEINAKAFGTMGVRGLDGAPKEPLYSVLQAARGGGGKRESQGTGG
jgi:hypothetical protein